MHLPRYKKALRFKSQAGIKESYILPIKAFLKRFILKYNNNLNKGSMSRNLLGYFC